MDAKLSCYIKGLIGVIFGCLALLVPDITLSTFLNIFGVLIIIGLIISIFLAITSRSEGSLFWFLAATTLVIIGVCSLLFSQIIALIFILVIAVVAFYSGISGINLALTRPKSKYYLIGGAFVITIAFLILLNWYMPSILQRNIIFTIVAIIGAFALVFGLFSIVMGWHIKEEPVTPVSVPVTPPVQPLPPPKEKE